MSKRKEVRKKMTITWRYDVRHDARNKVRFDEAISWLTTNSSLQEKETTDLLRQSSSVFPIKVWPYEFWTEG